MILNADDINPPNSLREFSKERQNDYLIRKIFTSGVSQLQVVIICIPTQFGLIRSELLAVAYLINIIDSIGP